MIILEIILLWSLYYFLHSFLATVYIKSKVEKSFPTLYPYYRILYNVLSFLLLIILYGLTESFEHKLLFPQSSWLKIFANFLLILGFIILFLSFKNYDKREFLGLTVSSNKTQLSTGGLNAYFRHPLYIGTILLLIGFFLLNPHLNRLLYVSISLLYLPIGSRLEELKLKQVFGEAYKSYLKKVKF
ncbi:MAG: methyltransferase family protein [Bacteroidia bacterium]